MSRQILASFDASGVCVYQAFRPGIAAAALRQGTFAEGFNLERMTWIKPSFGWMLYRSHYAGKHRQERILRIRVSHEGFLTILRAAVPTSFDPDVDPDPATWRARLDRTQVRYQWDPDRDLGLRPLPRRAIQIGLQGPIVGSYVNRWVVGLEDATPLARAVRDAVARGAALPEVPREEVYPLEPSLARLLGVRPGEE